MVGTTREEGETEVVQSGAHANSRTQGGSEGASSVNEMLLRVTWGRWAVFAVGQRNMCYLK